MSAVATSVLTPPPEPTVPMDFFKTPAPNPNDVTMAPGAGNSYRSAGPLVIGQTFGSRYRIVKMLGIGGMGAVYQAWDNELEVVVAIKVIRPEATADPIALAEIERRFKQELLLARQVTHTNVVRIHDLGEINGIKYITMSYIEGFDLATVLQRDGKLSVPTALALMRQIASGLQAAHEAGVVHRDLKPANIMIEGEQAFIMDFGIARSSATGNAPPTPANLPARGSPSVAQTMAGSVIGTITYMAPEQAAGEAVDQRADMYALGMIVSDMLLGVHRRGEDFDATDDLTRRMTQRPESLRKTDPAIPEAFDRIITRLLEPNPADRFQTTADLVGALDRLDDKGVPLPLIRRLTPRMIAAAAAIVLTLLAGTFYARRQSVVLPVQHDPISILIADFQNNTADAAFSVVLEPTLRRALEGAGFITAYDRVGLKSTAGVDVQGKFDEAAARDIAAKQGFGVIVAGTIAPDGGGFNLAIKAVQAATGNVIATGDRSAVNKADVLAAVTRLAATVRTALGDQTKESDQIGPLASLAATPLNVVGQPDEAREKFSAALDMDPKTDREKLRARGASSLAAGDYQKCVEQYGELIKRFEADVAGRRQRAVCMAKLRDMGGAVAETRYVVDLLPGVDLFRANLVRYANYAGEFAVAEAEARKLPASAEQTQLALAMSQIGQDRISDATGTFEALRTMSPLGASLASSGFADIALAQGRFADAIRILEQGTAAESKARNADAAARHYALLAYAELSRGRHQAAVAAAEKALAASDAMKIRFLAARTFIEAGVAEKARPLIDALASEAPVEPRAHAQILEGDLALKNGDARQAIKLLMAANALLDTWIGRLDLGRANFAAGAYVQADSEIDRCIKRRGEAISLFVDEDPSFGYFPVVYYYQGQIREALKNAGFTESYKKYLAFRGQSKDDPLVSEVRRRIAS